MEERSKQLYAAITADIVGSTAVYGETGRPIRPKLLEVLDALNCRFRDELAVPLRITLGDEFQGLAKKPSACPRIIYDARLHLSPLRCRFGVGIGMVVSGLADTTLEMEGPAFSLSREALEVAKKQKGRLTVYRTEDRILEEAANTVSILIDIVQSAWTSKQWEAVRSYTASGDLAAAGADLGITPQAVSDRLRMTHWREIADASHSLSHLLDYLVECSRHHA